MTDKETIEIFERIWHTDIINKMEPMYSVAISVAQSWTPSANEGHSNKQPLNRILLQRLSDNWERILIAHIDNHPVGAPVGNRVSTLFHDLREKYKDSTVLTQIINKIAKNITADILHGQPEVINRPIYPKANVGDHVLDPSCKHVHN